MSVWFSLNKPRLNLSAAAIPTYWWRKWLSDWNNLHTLALYNVWLSNNCQFLWAAYTRMWMQETFKQVQHSSRLVSQESCHQWRSRPLYGKFPGQSQGCMNQWGPPQGRIRGSSPIQTQISQWKWRNAAQRPPITKRTFRVQSEFKRWMCTSCPTSWSRNDWSIHNWCQRHTN